MRQAVVKGLENEREAVRIRALRATPQVLSVAMYARARCEAGACGRASSVAKSATSDNDAYSSVSTISNSFSSAVSPV